MEASPFWSPDSRFVGFAAQITTAVQVELWRHRADGSGAAEPWLRTATRGFGYVQARLSANEEWFVARTFTPTGTTRDIVAFRADGDGVPIPLMASPQFTEQGADLSPDGTLLAYSSDESGREEVYVRPFPDVDSGRATVSLAGGRSPQWAHNGREIFFIDAESRMNVAEIERAPSPRVIRREVLFTLQSTWLGGSAMLGDGGDDNYDVDVDDQRFLMGRLRGNTGASRASRFIVVENWLEEFRDQLGP
jgi:serine/threonine-protein kinase